MSDPVFEALAKRAKAAQDAYDAATAALFQAPAWDLMAKERFEAAKLEYRMESLRLIKELAALA